MCSEQLAENVKRELNDILMHNNARQMPQYQTHPRQHDDCGWPRKAPPLACGRKVCAKRAAAMDISKVELDGASRASTRESVTRLVQVIPHVLSQVIERPPPREQARSEVSFPEVQQIRRHCSDQRILA